MLEILSHRASTCRKPPAGFTEIPALRHFFTLSGKKSAIVIADKQQTGKHLLLHDPQFEDIRKAGEAILNKNYFCLVPAFDARNVRCKVKVFSEPVQR